MKQKERKTITAKVGWSELPGSVKTVDSLFSRTQKTAKTPQNALKLKYANSFYIQWIDVLSNSKVILVM
jgi:hypothetical protein